MSMGVKIAIEPFVFLTEPSVGGRMQRAHCSFHQKRSSADWPTVEFLDHSHEQPAVHVVEAITVDA